MDLAAPCHIESSATPLRLAGRGREVGALILVLSLQLLYFTGIASTDDIGYLDTVWCMQQGAPPGNLEVNQFFARFVHWGSIRVAITVFPRAMWAVPLPSMLSAMACMVLVGALAHRFIHPKLTVPAMLACGLVPINIVLASIALPEMIATALVWTAVALAARPLLDRDVAGSELRCMAAGLLIGAAYNAKETAAFFGPGLILFVLLCRTRRRWAWYRVGLLSLGSVAWLMGEALQLWRWTGDPLFHLHALTRSQDVYVGTAAAPSWTQMLHGWTSYLRWLADPRSVFAPLGVVFLAAVAVALVRRRPFTTLILCAILPALVYLSVGTTDLTSYKPVIRQPRYLVPILPGLALLTAQMIAPWWNASGWRRRAILALSLALAAVCLVGPNNLAGRWYHARTFTAGFRLISDHGSRLERGSTVYASGLTTNRFWMLSHWIDAPPFETLFDVPQTPSEWARRCGGGYVLTTRADHHGPQRTKHARFSLAGTSLEALQTFERVARVEPPRDRLSTLAARLLGRPGPTDPDHAVELWRVPQTLP